MTAFEPQISTMRHVTLPLVAATVTLLAGCEQRAPSVYVLEGEQQVVLTGSASPAQVQQGEKVVLHVERRITGTWKQISRDELKPGQCWVYRPPQQVEAEVAQSLQWVVDPERSVEFHSDYQMDQTRGATMLRKGKITLIPVSPVKCEEGRSVEGAPIEIEVS
ncbi:hypothetical protein [Steroidobacter sp.]|uniref:hypothetical protein n=1 Tax=Steroidobacter sp. TaxID=1978227 RepID=UPI0025E5E2F7|nr:hypothetical protein [Steroidobacter sp.]